MIELVTFQEDHLADFVVNDAGIGLGMSDIRRLAGEFRKAGRAYTGIRVSGAYPGRVMGFAGLYTQPADPGRATGWAILSSWSGRDMLSIHRQVKSFLDAQAFRRIEITVDAGFAEGIRWAEMLGFEREGVLRSYTPSGRDHISYARIRHG